MKAKVFYGIDQIDDIVDGEIVTRQPTRRNTSSNQPQWGAENPETIDLTFDGTDKSDLIKAGSGSQTVNGGDRNDRIISYGDAGEPDPAQTENGEGRRNDPLPEGTGNDVFTGGRGGDRFEFRALLNASAEVIAQHTGLNGHVNWRAVAGENDNVHDHWVRGLR